MPRAKPSKPAAPPEAVVRALHYATRIIENYQNDIHASAWTGVNLEAVGFCQGETYRTALETIDRIARGDVTV